MAHRSFDVRDGDTLPRLASYGNHNALVAALVHMINPLTAAVEGLGIGAIESLQAGDEVEFWRVDQQVKMIFHLTD